MKLALLQMTSGIEPAANAGTIVDAIERAGGEGAATVFTPEMSGLLDRDRARGAARITTEADDRVLAAVREAAARRSEEHTSELQSLMRISYAVFCLKQKNQ